MCTSGCWIVLPIYNDEAPIRIVHEEALIEDDLPREDSGLSPTARRSQDKSRGYLP
jgi:hypothetical protein